MTFIKHNTTLNPVFFRKELLALNRTDWALRRIRELINEANKKCFQDKAGFILKAHDITFQTPLPVNYNTFSIDFFDVFGYKSIVAQKQAMVECNKLSVERRCYICVKPMLVKDGNYISKMGDAVQILGSKLGDLKWDILDLKSGYACDGAGLFDGDVTMVETSKKVVDKKVVVDVEEVEDEQGDMFPDLKVL